MNRSTRAINILIFSISVFLTACGDNGENRTAATAPAGGSGTVQTSGGTLTTNLANVTVPPDTALQPVQITVTPISPPPGLPSGLVPVGLATDITVTNSDLINAPFLITLKYTDGNGLNENNMAVVHFNTTTNQYEPVTILAQNKDQNTITIESRTFSPFVIVTYALSLIPASYTVPGFSPGTNGWKIANFGNYFSPGGNCLGMAAYATWFFGNRSDQLFGKYSAVENPPNSHTSIAHLVAARAMLAQSQKWGSIASLTQWTLGVDAIAQLMRLNLSAMGQPLVLLLSTRPDGAGPTHASVLYGYDSTGFLFYDVDVPSTTQRVSFSPGTWGSYGQFRGFTFLANPSLGRTEDFGALTSQAEGEFTSSSLMSVTSPTQGQQITANSTTVAGSLSGALNPLTKLVAYVQGVFFRVVPVASGRFSTSVPVASGENTLTLLAGANIDNQSNWYPNAATLIRTFQGTSNSWNGTWVGIGTSAGGSCGDPISIVVAYLVQGASGESGSLLFTIIPPSDPVHNVVGATFPVSYQGNIAHPAQPSFTYTLNGDTMTEEGPCWTATHTRQ